ncbi:N-acetylmuramoyl-L-alanine amidase family protein, partial [Anaerotignum sp.]
MKGRNWRDFEPPEKRRRKPRRYEEPPRRYEDVYQPPKRKKRRRKGGIFRRLLVILILFVLGYGGFFLYYRYGKPYTVALDAGHGGEDVGSVGVIQEVQLTERTVTALEKLLKEDGRFRVVLTRKMGEGMSITDRNRKLAILQPDLMLSVHGNADETGEA